MRKVVISILIFMLLQAGAPYCAGRAADTPVANVIQKRSVAPDDELPDVLPLTLADCYSLALKQSETIAIDAEAIKITETHFLQALSIILPHISFISTDTREEEPNDPGTTFATLKPASSSERKFNVTQTLFNGFKAFAAIRGSDYERGQRVNEKIRAEQLLLVDVANAFYLLKEKREDLKALQKIRLALRNRIRELRKRENLGRSRPSEVVNARAQLYSVEADIELVKNQEVVARELLEYLVGGAVYSITDDAHNIPGSLQPEQHYVSRSDARPDVKATKFAWEVSKEESKAVDSDFLPYAYVEGNYYAQRTGFNKDTDWDVVLRVNVPIFDGGYTIGRSNEARSKARQKELEFRRARRRAPYDIREAYVRLNTALNVHKLLEKEFKTAKLNYHLQKRDYELSLVNNLDVLAAIQTLQNSERNFIHALYEAKRLYWQLRVAVGESITENLNDII